MTVDRLGTERWATTSVATKTLVTVQVTPTLLLEANIERLDFLINNTSAVTVTIGYDSTNIIEPIPAGGTCSSDTYFGPIYGTVTASTADVIVTEHA